LFSSAFVGPEGPLQKLWLPKLGVLWVFVVKSILLSGFASRFVFFFGRFMVSTMLDWSECTVVERGPGKSRSMWRFKGTHVPATLLFENLEDGATVNDFLDWYPGVTREQVLTVLEFAERSLVEA
jgi:uncharacterized protein (DUF433 family)